ESIAQNCRMNAGAENTAQNCGLNAGIENLVLTNAEPAYAAENAAMASDKAEKTSFPEMIVQQEPDGICVDTGKLKFKVLNEGTHLFVFLEDGRCRYCAEQFEGPFLITGGEKYGLCLETWEVMETGQVCTRLKARGKCLGSREIRFEIGLTSYVGKEWLEVSFRLINTTEDVLPVEGLYFGIRARDNEALDYSLDLEKDDFDFSGIRQMPEMEERYPVSEGRFLAGNSNYKTHFSIAGGEGSVQRIARPSMILQEGNEHFSEVLYGTFMADRTTAEDGICATLFQAQQNYPKAVKADRNGLMVMLVPEGVGEVAMHSGMSREQRFLLHFHDPKMSMVDIEDRSLIYQMPDRPMVDPSVFARAQVMQDVFVAPELQDEDVEIALVDRADSHARCFGMLNWGDAPDPGYTSQNRGKGKPVWTNNEYDYPHACFLSYARTGIRRLLDYGLVAAEHWMDVDVCHYSKDPLLYGGQWEHTRQHVVYGTIVPSHSWVEGLLDYYHFTGNERALETAVGIGENVMRLLETDTYQAAGETNARETGWALRTFTALYVETGEERWLEKADWIIGHFREWEAEYGALLAPYTDNTLVRTGFMIAVAVGSLMRYYRVFPSEDLKSLILSAVDDLYDNCRLPNGLFYYKELPSLNRNGKNTLLLEAMCIGFELTGDRKYLEAGKKTFLRDMRGPGRSSFVGNKTVIDDALIFAGDGPKGFAQSFLPLCTYYKVAREQGLI
ncbi:MAG: glycoside hydrolase family 127 protein, partial [Lachnospiraceae bacterium]|nr:glycoside hydrolase family 127 protein [Lachnospiraceae bacterium]